MNGVVLPPFTPERAVAYSEEISAGAKIYILLKELYRGEIRWDKST